MDLISQVMIYDASILLLTKFHLHSSGYDFGYLVKLLTCVTLPNTEGEFFDLLSTWFPTVYDVKYLMRACKQLKGGLQDVADDLGVSHFLIM